METLETIEVSKVSNGFHKVCNYFLMVSKVSNFLTIQSWLAWLANLALAGLAGLAGPVGLVGPVVPPLLISSSIRIQN